jgi:linoleoyl-CoA desaturase
LTPIGRINVFQPYLGRRVDVTAADRHWGERTATAVMDAPDERIVALTKAIEPSAREIAAAHRRLHVKATWNIAFVMGSYGVLVFAGSSPAVSIVVAGVLAIALAALATGVFHDANHGAFSSSRRINRIASLSGEFLGASSWIWRFKHNNLHHGNPNVRDVDSDIEQAPFARLSSDQEWRPRHRFQHIYLWFLYGFLALKWLLVTDFMNLRDGGINSNMWRSPPRRRDLVTLFLGKAVHVSWAIGVPLLFHPWWIVLSFYFGISWTVGFLLAIMFQLAHCNDLVEFAGPDEPRRGAAFAEHQLRTTADVQFRTSSGSLALRWLLGGLDFQVEHHLAPRLPHTVYPLVAARLDAVCAQRHLAVRRHVSLVAAIASHTRWLKALGRRPDQSAASEPRPAMVAGGSGEAMRGAD